MKIPVAALQDYAHALFTAAGLAPDKAATVAQFLLEGDLLGHSTHGLALAPWYLRDAAEGRMARDGDPELVSDRGAAICWRGRRLPGSWLIAQAIDLACTRAETHGTATVAISESHHTGALAAYLRLATDRGMMITISCSAPSSAQVAPFGGTTGVFTPNPVAHGIPTPGDPILIDISASITTVNLTQRLIREGGRHKQPWLMDRNGTPTDDPTVLQDGGTLLLTGGLDHGQKGYGMALATEAVTQGLAGWGRADNVQGIAQAITVTVYDPDAFGGRDAFLRQTGWLADACRAATPRDPSHPVRLPGQAGLAHRRAALQDGITLHPAILPALRDSAETLGVTPAF